MGFSKCFLNINVNIKQFMLNICPVEVLLCWIYWTTFNDERTLVETVLSSRWGILNIINNAYNISWKSIIMIEENKLYGVELGVDVFTNELTSIK